MLPRRATPALRPSAIRETPRTPAGAVQAADVNGMLTKVLASLLG